MKKRASGFRGAFAWLAKGALVLLALALLALGALWAASRLIPWDSVQQQTVALGSRALGRELRVGTVGWGLFSGLSVRGVQVANAGPGFSAQPLFSDDELKIGLNLRSLLKGKVRVEGVTLVRPQLLVETDAQGRCNLTGLGGAPLALLPVSAAPPGQGPTLSALKASSSPPPSVSGEASRPLDATELSPETRRALAWVPSVLVIRDGTVLLKDARRPGGDVLFRGINLELRNLGPSFDGRVRLDLTAALRAGGRDIPLSVKGDLGLDAADAKLKILKLDAAAPALSVSLTGTATGFDAPSAELWLKGKADLKRLSALLPLGPPFNAWQGKLEGQFGVQARVKLEASSKPLPDGLWASADFQITDGVLRRTETQERLAKSLPYAPIQRLLSSDIAFSRAQGRLVYGGGLFELQDFSLGSGADLRQGPEFVQASGWAKPKGGLDFHIIPHFNPNLGFPKGDMMNAFGDEKSWPTIDYIEYSGASFKSARADCTPGLRKGVQRELAAHGNPLNRLLEKLLGP